MNILKKKKEEKPDFAPPSHKATEGHDKATPGNEEKEEKKVGARQLREFREFREKMKGAASGNFRQKAESVGVLPEDVKEFKYWLQDNRE